MRHVLDPAAMSRVARAYSILVGSAPGVPCLLQRDGLRRAFRAMAMESHPDRAALLGLSEASLTARFQSGKRAHDYLCSVLGAEDELLLCCTAPAPAPKPAPCVPLPRRPAPTRATAKPLLGRYLLQKRVISPRQLVDAVAWQRSQRPLVGQIACGWRIIAPSDVTEILRAAAGRVPFCQAAVESGKMSSFHQLAVLGRQRSMHLPLGSYFVGEGIVEADELDRLALAARS